MWPAGTEPTIFKGHVSERAKRASYARDEGKSSGKSKPEHVLDSAIVEDLAVADHQTLYAGIIVRCQSDSIYYPGVVNQALEQIASKPLGRSLLKSITKRSDKAVGGFTVVINKPASHAMAELNGTMGPMTLTWTNKAVRFNEIDACNQTGTRSAVYWNPNILESPDGRRPPFIALAHELIHAMQNLRGTAYSDTRKEEFATVGLHEMANRRKRNENGIRGEHGIALRTTYFGLT